MVVLAALLNALKIVKKRLADARIVFIGAGASGIATAKLLMKAGAKHIIACDRAGALYRGPDRQHELDEGVVRQAHQREAAARAPPPTRSRAPTCSSGSPGPGSSSLKDIKAMNRDPIVFAMANPVPEILPEEAGPYVRVMATGRSDYPNQINNSCCFPGFFRGMLDVRARRVNDEMKLAAAQALAAIVTQERAGRGVHHALDVRQPGRARRRRPPSPRRPSRTGVARRRTRARRRAARRGRS